MGLPSVLLALVGVFTADHNSVTTNGFFHGYSPLVWTVVILQAIGGLVVAVVVKYAGMWYLICNCLFTSCAIYRQYIERICSKFQYHHCSSSELYPFSRLPTWSSFHYRSGTVLFIQAICFIFSLIVWFFSSLWMCLCIYIRTNQNCRPKGRRHLDHFSFFQVELFFIITICFSSLVQYFRWKCWWSCKTW